MITYPLEAFLDSPLVKQKGKTSKLELQDDIIPNVYATSSTPVNAVAAVGTITSDNTAPANGGTITIGSETWTVAASRTGAFTVAAGADGDAFLANLRTAINTDSTLVTAGTVNTGAHTLPVTWNVKGVVGNSVVFTETCTHITINGSGVLGGTTSGVNGTVGRHNEMRWDSSYLYLCTATNGIHDANWKKAAWV